VRTREPGGTPLGAQLRDVLLSPGRPPLTPKDEALLLALDRLRHVEDVIRPALAAGKIVVTDRYVDSTLAHQGQGGGLPVETLHWLIDYATGGLLPDLTVLLDVDVKLGIERRHRAYRVGLGEFNRIDGRELDYHERVRQGYLALAAAEPDRYLVLDARRPESVLEDEIWERVEPGLGPLIKPHGLGTADQARPLHHARGT
jgi:dTMP kinase